MNLESKHSLRTARTNMKIESSIFEIIFLKEYLLFNDNEGNKNVSFSSERLMLIL